jgi:ketosteroid isomerase-like protein
MMILICVQGNAGYKQTSTDERQKTVRIHEKVITATGKGFSVRACSFGEFENGKIKGRRDYWDSASLTKQLVGD